MIRKIKKEEYGKVGKIWLETNVKAHFYIPKNYWEKNYLLILNEYLPNSETFVFVENEIIKGFISILNENFIGALFISPEFQGEKIGTKLLNFCQEKYEELSLTVYEKNEKAVNFYKKNGFEILKTQKSDYENEQEFLMNWRK